MLFTTFIKLKGGYYMKLLSKLSKGFVASVATLSLLAAPAFAAESYGSANLGSNDVPVTVTFDEADDTIAAKAMIPTSINIKGKTGTYHVMAYCEADEVSKLNANLSITPADSFTLKKDGASTTVNAIVKQDKKTFTPSEVRNGTDKTYTVTVNGASSAKAVKEASAEGTITANSLTYGTWKGSLTFTISASK